jgi:transposase
MHVGTPHPEKIRLAIVRAFEREGLTYGEIARLLGVGEASVSRILRLHRETGSIAPRPKGGGRLSPVRGKVASKLASLVKATPDATVAELMEALVEQTGVATSASSMKRALHRLGFSRKKRSS